MIAILCAFILLLSPVAGIASNELVDIPAGQIEAIWLSPISKKVDRKSEKKTKTSKQMATVKAFKAMKYAVSARDFDKFVKDHPEWSKKTASNLFTDQYYLLNLNELLTQSERTPITYVSWFAARSYCESFGLRLPTVAEWEYMAAASEKKSDANKDPVFLRRILDWYGEPQGALIKPTGSIYMNKYGLWDMHGLIWEWVEDFNSTFVTGESREDTSFNKEMFCGAGSMASADKENYASFMRFAFRSSLKGKNSVWNLGFRCVK